MKIKTLGRVCVVAFTIVGTRLATAGYVANDPINFVDPRGLSAEDVEKIKNQFNNYVNNLIRQGQRLPGSGALAGMLNNFSRPVTGFQGCIDQRDGLGRQLSSEQYDDTWTFHNAGSDGPHLRPQSAFGFGIGPHHWLYGSSSNPNDPVLLLDPWSNIVMPVKFK